MGYEEKKGGAKVEGDFSFFGVPGVGGVKTDKDKKLPFSDPDDMIPKNPLGGDPSGVSIPAELKNLIGGILEQRYGVQIGPPSPDTVEGLFRIWAEKHVGPLPTYDGMLLYGERTRMALHSMNRINEYLEKGEGLPITGTKSPEGKESYFLAVFSEHSGVIAKHQFLTSLLEDIGNLLSKSQAVIETEDIFLAFGDDPFFLDAIEEVFKAQTSWAEKQLGEIRGVGKVMGVAVREFLARDFHGQLRALLGQDPIKGLESLIHGQITETREMFKDCLQMLQDLQVVLEKEKLEAEAELGKLETDGVDLEGPSMRFMSLGKEVQELADAHGFVFDLPPDMEKKMKDKTN